VGWLVGRNRWLFNRRSPVAIALAALVYFAPFAVSVARTGSGEGLWMVYRENLLRFFQPINHRDPVYLYVYVIFGLLAPWSVFLPAALAQAHAPRRDEGQSADSDRFVRVYFWATFLFFTLSGSRRSYYLLPILPAGALLVARLLTEPSTALSAAARHLLRLGYAVLAVGVVLSAAAFLPPSWVLPRPWSDLPAAPVLSVFGLCWLACLAGVGYALCRFRPDRVAISTAVVAYASMAYLFLVALPAADVYRNEKPFAEEVRRRLSSETAGLALYRTREPVFYLRLSDPIPEYETVAALAAAVRDGGVRWLLLRRRDLAGLGLSGTVEASEASFPWEGEDQRGNKVLLLRLAPDRGSNRQAQAD
jgi:4-amino-4-deoxy-L-arabinose transferase-like glycosyltransferase